ncbi:hypothetical protein DITRI_Ditri16bG0133200 [Diplodiscus trichospermus]
MGGIGKTTLARVVYTQMSPLFEGKSFLASVREVSEKYGLVSLQKQLLSQILLKEGFNIFNVHEGNAMISHMLSHKKVLVVIDDVDNIQHLKCLVGRRDWFGLGSKIIVTTRDEHLLRSYRVDDVYKPSTLDDNEALRLFNLKALSSIVQENDFVELSKQVVEYADGLPLALEVLGSFLCGRDASQWRSAIERLTRDSNKEIHGRLKVSFDGLEETEKNIFLDIACFFKGEDKDFVINVLDGCDFFSNIGIDVLTKKSLIKVDEGNKLWMHDLLQEMGRKIVRQKSIDEPGKRCRLWDEKDVNLVLTKNTATEAVEGMVIDNKGEQNKTFLSADAFLKMKNLRLLRVFYLTNSQDLKHLSNKVRLFEWHGYPFKSLPSSFQLDNLVALILPYSSIKHLWKGNNPLYKLKLINLKGSQDLIRTPEFTMTPNLESLILEGCSRIVDIHPSIGVLRNLVSLNLKDCCNLVRLPSSIDGFECLKALNLSGCSKLEILPDNLQHVEFLEELDLSETAITKPPSFIFQFKKLKVLSFNGCKGPPSKLRPNLPSFFKLLQRGSTDSMALMLTPLSGLVSLKKLNLSDCNLGEGAIPSDIRCLSSLKELYLSGNNFINLPATIARLSKLQFLELSDCRKLKSLPGLLSIEQVMVHNCISLEVLAGPTTASTSLDWALISGVNTYKLMEKNNALTMLKKHIKVLANARRCFDILTPGSEIPKWFCHQRDESSIMIPLPHNIQNDSKWMGIAFCCIFVIAFKDDDAWEKGEEIMCKAAIHGRNSRRVCHSVYNLAKKYRLPKVIRDHLWLRYWSRDYIYPTSSEYKCGDTENLLSSNFEHEASDDMFESIIDGGVSLKVKKCGVRLFYEKDLDMMEELKEQCRNATSAPNFNDNGVTGKCDAILKRKRNTYEEEAGRTSEINSAKETPQPKRLQTIINYITGKKH